MEPQEGVSTTNEETKVKNIKIVTKKNIEKPTFGTAEDINSFLTIFEERKVYLPGQINSLYDDFFAMFESLRKKKFKKVFYIRVINLFIEESVVNDENSERKINNWSLFFNGDKFVFEDRFISFALSQKTNVLNGKKIIQLFNALIEAIPEKKVEILFSLEKINRQFGVIRDENLNKMFADLLKRVQNVKVPEPPLSILPTTRTINTPTNNSLLTNMYATGWSSFQKYRETIFRIGMEDFLTSFKNGLKDLRANNLDYRDLYLYNNVKLSSRINENIELRDVPTLLDFQVRWPLGRKKPAPVDWRRTERFCFNNLLLISKNEFCSTVDAVAVSLSRNDSKKEGQDKIFINLLNKGTVPVRIVSGVIDPNKTYFMFESNKRWGAVETFLKCLADLDNLTFPISFANPLIMHNFSSSRISTQYEINFQKLFKNKQKIIVNTTRSIPFDATPEAIDQALTVDHQQLKPLWFSLRNKVTLVNGGPGTGKTHFAREVAKLLYNNGFEGPIIVITYTNHSIDAFLEGIIDHVKPKHILRHGGAPRTTNEKVLSRNFNHRMLWYPRNGKNYSKEITNSTKAELLLNEQLVLCNGLLELFEGDLTTEQQKHKAYKIMRKLIETIAADATRLIKKIRPIRIVDLELFYRSGITIDDQKVWELWMFGKDYILKKYKRDVSKEKKIIVESPKNRFKILFNNGEEEEEEEKEEESENEVSSIDYTDKSIVKQISDIKNDPAKMDDQKEKNTNSEEQNINIEEDEYDSEDALDNDILFDFENSIFYDENDNPIDTSDLSRWILKQFSELLSQKRFDIKQTTSIIQAIMLTIKSNRDELSESISELYKEKENYDALIHAELYKQMRIIGMTATIASVHRKAISMCGCRYMIIEEAGELTEIMTVPVLPQTLEHLVLIGDYNQLRPKVEHEMTMKPINYDISAFERLALYLKENLLPQLFTLTIQRRMHPEISCIIRDVFCPDMIDDHSTYNRPVCPGVLSRVSFVLHNKKDNRQCQGTRSYSSMYEAEYISALCFFFMSRGFSAKDITVVSLYKGQMYLIKEKLEELWNNLQKQKEFKSQKFFDERGTRNINVVVLDNYQGEENEVIIVSIVRSDKLGFVKARNRALVTLSRARSMMVVVGYGSLLKSKEYSEHWPLVIESAKKHNKYSVSEGPNSGIYVRSCQKHIGNDIIDVLDTPSKLIQYRGSFCNEKCDYVFPCGHKCTLHCHGDDHSNIICFERCSYMCENGHQCTGKCGICSNRRYHEKCNQNVTVIMNDCGHEAVFKCYETTDKDYLPCPHNCQNVLPCGHTCSLHCSHEGECKCNATHNIKCPVCKKDIPTKCGSTKLSDHKCSHILPCGHQCQGKCFDCYRNGHHKACEEECSFIFPCCHKKCGKKCCDTKEEEHQHLLCYDCTPKKKDIVKKTYECEECKTVCQITPGQMPETPSCEHKCTKVCTDCGEECHGLCEEQCVFYCKHHKSKNNHYKDGLQFAFPCGHVFELSEAKRLVTEQFNNIFSQKGDKPTPLMPIGCPQCRKPLIQSWLFAKEIFLVREALFKLKEIAQPISKSPHIRDYAPMSYPYLCPCGNIFYQMFEDRNKLHINCPACGFCLGAEQN